MRIDMHFFAYKDTSSQLTEICKQVISVSIVISSVDIRNVSDSTLRAIVQNVYGGLPVDMNAILAQLQEAAKGKSLLSSPTPEVVAAHLSRAVRKVGYAEEEEPILEKVTVTIGTTIGSAANSARRFEDYLNGGIIQAYTHGSETDIELYEASVLFRVPDYSISDSVLVGEVQIELKQRHKPSLQMVGMIRALAKVVRGLLSRAGDSAVTNLPLTSFEIGIHPPPSITREPLSDDEWTVTLKHFSREKLEGRRNKFLKTAEQTESYNCIAWSMGSRDQWMWPSTDLRVFISFCKSTLSREPQTGLWSAD